MYFVSPSEMTDIDNDYISSLSFAFNKQMNGGESWNNQRKETITNCERYAKRPTAL